MNLKVKPGPYWSQTFLKFQRSQIKNHASFTIDNISVLKNVALVYRDMLQLGMLQLGKGRGVLLLDRHTVHIGMSTG